MWRRSSVWRTLHQDTEGSWTQLRGLLCHVARGLFMGCNHETWVRAGCLQSGCVNMRSQGNHRDGTSVVITAAVRLHGLRLQQLLLFTVETSVSKAARDTSAVSDCCCAPPSPKDLNIYIWLVTHIWQKKKTGKKSTLFHKEAAQKNNRGLNTAADSSL